MNFILEVIGLVILLLFFTSMCTGGVNLKVNDKTYQFSIGK